MSTRLDELGDDTAVALVTFGDRARVDAYANDHSYRFPILHDVDRSVYRAYGLGRGSVSRIWGLRAARTYLKLYREQRLRPASGPTDDTLQLGGDFVIGTDGTLRFAFWGAGPDDRPSVDRLVDEAAAARRKQ